MTCMSCKYSDTPRDQQGKVVLGQASRICKRFPPAHILLPDQHGRTQLQYCWPIVGLMDECGEYCIIAGADEIPGVPSAEPDAEPKQN